MSKSSMNMIMFLAVGVAIVAGIVKRCEWFGVCGDVFGSGASAAGVPQSQEELDNMLRKSVIMKGDRKKFNTPYPTNMAEKGAQQAGDLMSKVIGDHKDVISKSLAGKYASANYSSLYGTSRVNYF